MDWMYKEHEKSDKPPLDVKDHDSGGHTSTNQQDTLGITSLSDEKVTAKQTMSELDAEDSGDSSAIDTALSSIHKFTSEYNSQKTDHEEDIREVLSDSGSMPSEEIDTLYKSEIMNTELPADGLERFDKNEQEDTINKDEVIKTLKEEVNLLMFLQFSFINLYDQASC